MRIIGYFLTVLLSFSWCSHAQNPDAYAAAMEAMDRRDSADPIFQALDMPQRHQLLGMIGDDIACARIQSEIEAAEYIEFSSLYGYSFCREKTDASLLLNALKKLEGPVPLSDPRFAAFGAVGEAVRPALGQLIDQVGRYEIPLVDAFMQSLAYSGLSLEAVPHPDFEALESKLGDNRSVDGFHAFYYLEGRIKGLEALPHRAGLLNRLQRAQIDGAEGPVIRAFAMNVRRAQGYGARLLPMIDRFLDNAPDAVRYEAVRLLAGLGDEGASRLMSFAGAGYENAGHRAYAIARLAQGEELSADRKALFTELLQDESAWVRAAALTALAQYEPDEARPIAADWLKGDDLYLARKAVGILAGDETGTSYLRSQSAQNPDSRTARIALPILDRDAYQSEPRPTPSYAAALASAGKTVSLETNKGIIRIAFNKETPFAADNFVELVEKAMMDGMIFHRVIPNFVAQWGESDRLDVVTWPLVRDNWLSGDHDYGTVGVATAGKDTGSAQFFININHNRHLTHRYTSVGRVIAGMEIAENLEEGDVILFATVEED